MVLGLLVGCAGEAPLEATSVEPSRRAVNQFKQRSEALTLSDGGLCPITVNADAELMIRALPVVEEPLRTNWSGALTNPSDGAWAFGRLMTAMAGANDPELFVRNWLGQWDAPRQVNGLTVPPRNMNGLVTQPWLNASGGGRLDLRRAPFRLLAIVNRMDLRDLSRGSAGEGRFVFGVLDPAGNPMQFTVILEFNLPATSQAEIDQWAADWHALGSLPIGSPPFNTALEAITNRFAGANVSPGRPNGSAINQVRSNEIALSAPWEMREFTLNAAGQLVQTPVAQTADLPFNNSPALAQFINQNEASLITATHTVPAQLNGAPFLAGAALTPGGFFWSAPGITNPEARFQFSINTCNGCHAGETQTPFLHVFPRGPGQVANLSGFLTGINVRDPVSGQNRTLNDLLVRSESLLGVLCREPNAPIPASVRITAPTAGSTVRGPSTFSAAVSGAVDAVHFFVDGVPVAPPTPAPFSLMVNGDQFVPGPHTLTAVGLSASGLVNSAPIAFTVAPSAAPDFTTRIVTAPALLELGQELVASVEVCNRGTLPGFTDVELFISTNATVETPPDFVVGRAPVSLSPAECRTVTVRGPAFAPPPAAPPPPGVVGNPVQLIAIADRIGTQPELDETNNTNARALVIGAAPDFTVSGLKVPVALLPGAPFTVSFSACNNGNRPGGTDFEVIASDDATIQTPPDIFIGNQPRVQLGVGQCQTVTVNAFTLPPNAPFVAVRAVRGDPELSVANNTSAVSRINIGTLPDFTVSSVTASAAALPGGAISASATVCNQGTVPAPANLTFVFASSRTFTFPSPTVVPIGTATASIDPARCVSLTLVGGVAPGGFTTGFVAAIVDAPNVVVEFSETNNQLAASTATAIGALPDFQVTGISTTGNALRPGTAFTATATVCNRGSVAGATEVELRLGGLAVGRAPLSMAVNQCLSQVINAIANPPGPGTEFGLTAVADPRNITAEFNEANNTSGTVMMAVGLGPDFVVSSIAFPSVVAPFTPFTATVTVCNRGTQPGTTQVDLFVSTDSVVNVADFRLPGSSVTLNAAECRGVPIVGSMNVPVPPPAPPALGVTAFLGAIVDVDGFVPELREGNNVGGTRSFVLGRGADLVVSSLSAPATVVAGSTFSTTISVCNRGNERAASNVDLLMSLDSTLSTSHPIAFNDVFVTGPGNTFFDLAAGACETRVLQAFANTPMAQRGAVFFGAVVDLNQSVPELTETNNTFVRAITVQ